MNEDFSRFLRDLRTEIHREIEAISYNLSHARVSKDVSTEFLQGNVLAYEQTLVWIEESLRRLTRQETFDDDTP